MGIMEVLERVAADTGEVIQMAYKLTPELFEEACGGTIRASDVTPGMINLVRGIEVKEAQRLNKTPSSEWWCEPTVSDIEYEIPRCRDRHVQAVLTVAEQWGDDDWDRDIRVAID